MIENGLYIGMGAGILSLVVAFIFSRLVLSKPRGTELMQKINEQVQKGAASFLKTEYRILVVFVVVVAACLWIFIDSTIESTAVPGTMISFIVGALFSMLSGWIGMKVATKAAAPTTEAAKTGLNAALNVAFRSGAVMGLCVVGFGLAGVATVYFVFGNVQLVFGFSLGASSIALFARVGGGIFTKAADVGSDLVGKVEAGIPEDDPRNPGVIADNVGDNVGDVAGMGADLYESYVGSIIATMAVAAYYMSLNAERTYATAGAIVLPILVAAGGVVASIIGTFAVRTKKEEKVRAALFNGLVLASVLFIVITAVVINFTDVTITDPVSGSEFGKWSIFTSILIGLGLGLAIGKLTEVYTSEQRGFVKFIARQSQTGAGTNLIAGLAVGMQSVAPPLVLIAAAVYASYHIAGLYGASISAVGMLSTLGISLATDAYGPVADNAGGLAEMSHCEPNVRNTTDTLDAVGNSTAAIGKGFAIGSAALTALALFQTYAQQAGIRGVTGLNILSPDVMAGLFLGVMLPLLFSSMTMKAVGRAASSLVDEVRRQWKEIPGLMEGKAEPDSETCVEMTTKAAIREMVLPSLLAILSPIAIGLLLGTAALGGLLAGALLSGVIMAIMMANAGGAWDNAKKYIEKGEFGGKGSDAHKAAVVGDTVGDPFKDTSGPSLNVLIKLMAIVSLVFIPVFKSVRPTETETSKAPVVKRVEVGQLPARGHPPDAADTERQTRAR
jgi:K(+)-stimulated pyrophosphate-energized sodium pump